MLNGSRWNKYGRARRELDNDLEVEENQMTSLLRVVRAEAGKPAHSERRVARVEVAQSDGVWAEVESNSREYAVGEVVSKALMVSVKRLEVLRVMFVHLRCIGGEGTGLKTCQTFEGFVGEQALDESLARYPVNKVSWPLKKE